LNRNTLNEETLDGVPVGRVVIVGLGPSGPELVTGAAIDAIARIPIQFVRTTRHPSVTVVRDDATSFDYLYEQAATIDEVYRGIVEALVEAATAHGEVLYAVPGSPRVAERAVDLLCADDRVAVDVIPALSFVDLAWVRLGVDPFDAGVRIVDGHRFGVDAAGATSPMLVGQCDSHLVLSDIKLSVEEGPAELITVLQRLGLPDEAVFTVSWDELDRVVTPDHLTSLYLPALAAPVAGELARFDELVRTLRRDCPWDAEQTHESLRRHLVEEAYEVLDALDATIADPDVGYPHLEEELGDLLFQIFFHAVLAAEQGQFTMADVARTVHDKLHDRHPHVFDDVVTDPSAAAGLDVVATWEQIKKAEKGRSSVMEGIPRALPALLLALKSQKKAATEGYVELSPGDATAEIERVLGAGVDSEPALGEALFAMVTLARAHDLDPEAALRSAARSFQARFEQR
jgi:tetrapyrrole methylase family protein/MazG family protein